MSKTSTTKCRAKGGPAWCSDPACPERNHRAAREAQAKNSFIRDALLTVTGRKNPPLSLQAERDRADFRRNETERLEQQIVDIDQQLDNPKRETGAASQPQPDLIALLEQQIADIDQQLGKPKRDVNDKRDFRARETERLKQEIADIDRQLGRS